MIKSLTKFINVLNLCFRLLNSEIGNDLYLDRDWCRTYSRFRLLNSEIGNDPTLIGFGCYSMPCFRLLNSEIGNDRL